LLVALFLQALACAPPVADSGLLQTHACDVTINRPLDYSEDDEDLVPADWHLPVLGPDPMPFHVHVGVHEDPAYDATLVWRTDIDTHNSQAQIAAPDGAWKTVDGASFTTIDESSRIHEVRLCDLQPATRYDYRVGGAGAWSKPQRFETAPPDGETSVRFAVAGDSRDNPEVWGRVLRSMAFFEPAFILHTGDMVSMGSMLDQWDDWFGENSGTLERIPLLPVHGNHEFMAPTYFGLFAAPGNEQWYSLDWGPVHLAVLNDSDKDELIGQACWLTEDLASTDRPWIIGSHHQPSWTAGSHDSYEELRTLWGGSFDQYPRSLVFNGHNHMYERTVPLVGELEIESGTTYVTAGGGGAPLYGSDDEWFLATHASVYHYVIVDVTPTSLQATAYRLDGAVLDSFGWEK